ncbi:MAG: glutamate--tRNA ligase [Gammaproteobacteria bacterium]
MIRTRFAPSPTGRLHLGNVRTALFSALYAAKQGGAFVLRVEDTDAARSRESHIASQLEDLRWLGLEWNEGPDLGGPHEPYRQSERGAIYARYFDRLAADDRTYPCFCSAEELAAARAAALAACRAPRYSGTCARLMPEEAQRRLVGGELASLRFRVPPGRSVVFDDLVRGEQRMAADDLGDFVVRRTDGSPAFFFANALDDALMEITHVLRGEDHLTNTPRQLLILEALGLTAPRYGHLPLVLDLSGKPLSKRDASIGLADLREAGILPDALANYLLRLGHATMNAALLDVSRRASEFDPAHLGRAPAHFDAVQLAHWQRLAVHALDSAGAAAWAGAASVPQERWPDFWALVRDNVESREDVATWADALMSLPDVKALGDAPATLMGTAVELAEEPDYEAFVRELKERSALGGRKLFQPLRAALTGRHDGPELARLWTYFTPAERREHFRHAHKVIRDAVA